MNFTTTEYVLIQRALIQREPSILVKFNERLVELYKQLFDKGNSYDRDDLLIMFNSLLVITDRTEMFDVYRYTTKDTLSNEELEKITTSLLCRLWIEVKDRRKEEALWSMSFRAKLDSWNIPYKEDMIRIGVPEIVEDEE